MKYCRKTRIAACLVMMLFMIASMGQSALATDGETAAYYKLVDVQRGSVTGGAKINVREDPDANSDRLGRLRPGESCIITGEEGDWWQVEFEGETGYVLKDLLTVTSSQEDEAVYIDEPLEAEMTDLEPPMLLEYRNDYVLRGTVKSNIPLISVSAEIFDERSMETERSYTDTMKRDDKVRSYELEDMEDELSFHKLSPGEKTLLIRAEGQSESMVVAEIPFFVEGEVYEDEDGISINPYPDMVHLTSECDIEVPDGNPVKMIDREYRTMWTFPSADDRITITLPEGRTAELMTIHWNTAPDEATIELLDENDQTLSVITEDNPNGRINFSYDIDAAARKIRVGSADGDKAICELKVYEKGKVSPVVQQWEEIPEKVDMLIISTHQDDEMLFFGGTIPYYSTQDGKTVAVVYMADCSRRRYAEALEGLWSCGLKYHPIFVGFRDARIESYQETVDLWGEDTTVATLVDIIRKYQPEVVLTHDVKGEYGHNQHIVTCACVRKAVSQSGDPAISPDSAAQYGTWTPKKLYLHLYEENQLFMEHYDAPVDELGGMSMTQIATIGYYKHVSQQEFFSMENQGVKYDNRKYGLAFTTVGEDVEKNDFFENID